MDLQIIIWAHLTGYNLVLIPGGRFLKWLAKWTIIWKLSKWILIKLGIINKKDADEIDEEIRGARREVREVTGGRKVKPFNDGYRVVDGTTRQDARVQNNGRVQATADQYRTVDGKELKHDDRVQNNGRVQATAD